MVKNRNYLLICLDHYILDDPTVDIFRPILVTPIYKELF